MVRLHAHPLPPHPSFKDVFVGMERGRYGWVEWFIECQALGRMIRLHAHPLPPSPSVSKLPIFLSLPVCRRSRVGGEGGLGSNSYDREKAWPSVNHSILSVRGLRRGLFVQSVRYCSVLLNGTYVYFSYLNKGSSPALSLSSLSGKLKLPTFKVLCVPCYRVPRSQN